MLNPIKTSYGGKRPPPVATRRLSEESQFFCREGISGRFFTSHRSGQDGFRAVADGTFMGNTTDILVTGGGRAGLAAPIAARKKGFPSRSRMAQNRRSIKPVAKDYCPAHSRPFANLASTCRQATGRSSGAFASSTDASWPKRKFTGEGGIGVRLVGGQGTLATPKPLKTVGSFWPYATTLWDYINRAMPYDEPGRLTAPEVYGAVAFVLHLNGPCPFWSWLFSNSGSVLTMIMSTSRLGSDLAAA